MRALAFGGGLVLCVMCPFGGKLCQLKDQLQLVQCYNLQGLVILYSLRTFGVAEGLADKS